MTTVDDALSQWASRRNGAVHPLSRRVRRIASSVLRTTRPAEPAGFDPSMVAALPEPARRWLVHAIAPSAPLTHAVELHMQGSIRIRRWRPFIAAQVLAPDSGYVWAAHARIAGLPVTGFDSFADGIGAMRWRILGVLPIQSASGPDITRSAAGRLAGESVLVPTSLVGAAWQPGPDSDTAVLVRQVGEHNVHVRIRVGPDGRLECVSFRRWGDPDGTGFRSRFFSVTFDGELETDGLRLPNGIRAAWDVPSAPDGGEFFRAQINGIVIV